SLTPASSTITTSLSSSTVMPGSSTTLTVGTMVATQPGSYRIDIRGIAGDIVRTRTIILNVFAPDFSLTFEPNRVTVKRGAKGELIANIVRIGGFAGNVTVSVPDTKDLMIKLTPPSQSSTGASVKFKFNIKKKAPVGPKQLIFTGKDDSGRTRMGTLF